MLTELLIYITVECRAEFGIDQSSMAHFHVNINVINEQEDVDICFQKVNIFDIRLIN